MLLPGPPYVNAGDTAWQLVAGTLVGLQAVPGLAVLYGSMVHRRLGTEVALMCLYAFASVLIVWTLGGYGMAFGTPLHLGPGPLSAFIGRPAPVLSALFEQTRASIPLLQGHMPALRFPMPALVYFQFAFAAIAPVILAGSLIGRIDTRAWMLFVPLWAALVYPVNAFLLWGGGWLAQLGAVDYSGGYVIHVAAGVSGAVAVALIGRHPLGEHRPSEPPQPLLAIVGAGILWLGWNGFNGGDPYFANANATLAILNTNVAAAAGLVTWMGLDMWAGHVRLSGALSGLIAGLVAITPAAGFVNGYGALAIGVASGVLPRFTMSHASRLPLFRRIDDTLGVFHTHAVAGAIGGLLTGILADPAVSLYTGAGRSPGVVVTGLLAGNPHLLLLQAVALAVVVGYSALVTFGIVKVVAALVPLRSAEPLAMMSSEGASHAIEEVLVP